MQCMQSTGPISSDTNHLRRRGLWNELAAECICTEIKVIGISFYRLINSFHSDDVGTSVEAVTFRLSQ